MMSPRCCWLLTIALFACDDGKTVDSETPDDSEAPNYESGCILVDGGNGYRYLADALTVADEGSVITLCEGTLDETITIEKSVTIEGPGPDLLTWNAPVNEAAIRISGASGVNISGFALTTTRNGIELDGATNVEISDVRFDTVANTAIRSIDSAGLTVSGCTFNAPNNGGVQVDGGSATVADSTFNSPLGYAVNALGGAAVTVTGSLISGVLYTDSTNISDGFALWALDGSSITTDGNTLADNFVHIWGDESALYLANDTITGGLYGVFADFGGITMDGVTLTDVYAMGVRALTYSEVIDIRNTQITATSELVDPDEYSFTNFVGGGLTVITDGEATLTDVDVSGYNNNGLLVIGAQDAPTLTATRVNLTSLGRRALTIYGGTATLEDVVVSDVSVYGTQDTPGNYNDQTPGLAAAFWSANVTWTGGGITDTEDMGLINYAGAATFQNFTLAGNLNYGIWNYQGSVFMSGSTITRSSGNGGVMNMYGELTLEGNAFTDNLEPYIYEYSYDDGTGNTVYVRTEQSYYSQDVSCLDGLSCVLRGNTFLNGSRGVQISGGGDAVIEDNSFENYNSYLIYMSSVTDGTVEVTDNTMINAGSYPIYCYGSNVEIDGLSIDGVVGSNQEYASYTNGVESYRYSYTSSSPAIYFYSCSVVASDLEVADAAYHAINAQNSPIELYDTTVSDGSSGGDSTGAAVLLNYSSVEPAVLVSGLEISSPAAGNGLKITSSSSLSAGLVDLQDVLVDGAAASGISLDQIHGASLAGLELTNNALYGLTVTESSFSMSDSELAGNGAYGAWIQGDSADVSIQTSVFHDNAWGGVYLSDANATFTANEVTNNDGYGMTCASDLTLASCSGNDLSGNSVGEHDGCDDACGQ